MDSIEIEIKRLGTHHALMLDLNKKSILINGNSKYITQNKIDELFRIIRNFQSNINNSNIIDSDEIIIIVNINNIIEKIHIKGENINKYNALIDWMNDLYE